MPIRIATWNVNSVKARLPNVLEWLKSAAPDVLLLQEIKSTDDTFPLLEFQAEGYTAAVHGQKTYNGVAILSKLPMTTSKHGGSKRQSPDTASLPCICPTAIPIPARNLITN